MQTVSAQGCTRLDHRANRRASSCLAVVREGRGAGSRWVRRELSSGERLCRTGLQVTRAGEGM